MPWVSPTTRATDYIVTAANWNEFVNNFLYQNRVANGTFSADVSITATTVGTANQIVATSASPTYEAVPHRFEFFTPQYTSPAQTTRFLFRDSTTVLGTLCLGAPSVNISPFCMAWTYTPTAAAHTFNVAAWLSGAGTGTVEAGTGGTAGDATTFLGGSLNVYRIPT